MNYLIIGINGHVVAINKTDGAEVWRTKLRSSTITVVSSDERCVYASASGYLYCLDKNTGSELWVNELKGLGYGTCLIDTGVNNAVASSAAETANVAATTAATAAIVAAGSASAADGS